MGTSRGKDEALPASQPQLLPIRHFSLDSVHIYIWYLPPIDLPFASLRRWSGRGVALSGVPKMLKIELSVFWSSPKAERPQYFCDFEAKTLQGPKDSKDSTFFGGLARLYPKSERLRPLSTLGLWSCKTLRGSNLLEFWTSARLSLSVFWSSHSPKVLEPSIPKCCEASIFL